MLLSILCFKFQYQEFLWLKAKRFNGDYLSPEAKFQLDEKREQLVKFSTLLRILYGQEVSLFSTLRPSQSHARQVTNIRQRCIMQFVVSLPLSIIQLKN